MNKTYLNDGRDTNPPSKKKKIVSKSLLQTLKDVRSYVKTLRFWQGDDATRKIDNTIKALDYHINRIKQEKKPMSDKAWEQANRFS